MNPTASTIPSRRFTIATGAPIIAPMSSFNEETKLATCEVTTFDSENAHWRRADFTLHQTCHTIGAAQAELLKAGFKDVTLYDARDAGMSGDAGYARTFFLAIA
ncbi:MAG: hypothetical protein M3N93_09700 [Acidobacteriota bacterium]|nr:hypothetical protein [Acidobacteriota bacterium]